MYNSDDNKKTGYSKTTKKTFYQQVGDECINTYQQPDDYFGAKYGT